MPALHFRLTIAKEHAKPQKNNASESYAGPSLLAHNTSKSEVFRGSRSNGARPNTFPKDFQHAPPPVSVVTRRIRGVAVLRTSRHFPEEIFCTPPLFLRGNRKSGRPSKSYACPSLLADDRRKTRRNRKSGRLSKSCGCPSLLTDDRKRTCKTAKKQRLRKLWLPFTFGLQHLQKRGFSRFAQQRRQAEHFPKGFSTRAATCTRAYTSDPGGRAPPLDAPPQFGAHRITTLRVHYLGFLTLGVCTLGFLSLGFCTLGVHT
jgi:hypothetical protein